MFPWPPQGILLTPIKRPKICKKEGPPPESAKRVPRLYCGKKCCAVSTVLQHQLSQRQRSHCAAEPVGVWSLSFWCLSRPHPSWILSICGIWLSLLGARVELRDGITRILPFSKETAQPRPEVVKVRVWEYEAPLENTLPPSLRPSLFITSAVRA